LQCAVMVTAIVVFAVIAYHDLRTRRIPNALTAAVALLGLLRIGTAGDAAVGGYTIAAALTVFVITSLLYWRGIIGGGDAKLIPAAVLLVGHRELLGFLFQMSLFGGVLALAVLASARLRVGIEGIRWAAARSWMDQTGALVTAPRRPTVPYGVAVAAAGAITLITAR
jgi:prepilin peptidase CpaA